MARITRLQDRRAEEALSAWTDDRLGIFNRAKRSRFARPWKAARTAEKSLSISASFRTLAQDAADLIEEFCDPRHP